MPATAKTPFSKNPATIAKNVGAGTYSGNTGMQGGEVVCPLYNSDGSQCRKKCIGNFAYRSICEHIRRAHPDNWIPKLPASPETFAKMVGMTPRGSIPSPHAPMQHQHHGVLQRKQNSNTARKPSKLSKYEDDHYMDTMSPPSSAHDSDSLPPVSSHGAPHQNFQSRFPPPAAAAAAAVATATTTYAGVAYERDEDDDMDDMGEMDGEHGHHHTETETEDDDHPYGLQRTYGYQGYMPQAGQKNRVSKSKAQKRKRQSTLNSAASSSSSLLSRWDELIEAATKRATIENTSMPPSPPQTAQTLPSICPNTPSATSSASSTPPPPTPKVQCAECRSLAPMQKAYVCTECVAGFCEDCALMANKRGVCGECRALGAKFKPLKVVVHA